MVMLVIYILAESEKVNDCGGGDGDDGDFGGGCFDRVSSVSGGDAGDILSNVSVSGDVSDGDCSGLLLVVVVMVRTGDGGGVGGVKGRWEGGGKGR